MIDPQARKKAVKLIRAKYPLSVVVEETGLSEWTVQLIRQEEELGEIKPDPSPIGISRLTKRIRKYWGKRKERRRRVEKSPPAEPLIHITDLGLNTSSTLLLDISRDSCQTKDSDD